MKGHFLVKMGVIVKNAVCSEEKKYPSPFFYQKVIFHWRGIEFKDWMGQLRGWGWSVSPKFVYKTYYDWHTIAQNP